jgi:hypothetical protein
MAQYEGWKRVRCEMIIGAYPRMVGSVLRGERMKLLRITGVKRFRIVKDKIRLLKDRIRDTVMETCCGLHNFRLQYRPWHYAL